MPDIDGRQALVLSQPHQSADCETFYVACRSCDIEWGWTREAPGVYIRLSGMALSHDVEVHGRIRGDSDA